MIDKYLIFRKLMDLVADGFTVVDADMNNWADSMEIVGECDGQKIILTATLKEENKDGN